MNLRHAVKKYGVFGTAQHAIVAAARKSRRLYCRWSVRNAPRYVSPTAAELEQIELELAGLGVTVHDYSPPAEEFAAFVQAGYFPSDYHGGVDSGVWDEKLLEHWITADLLGLMQYEASDIYVDVAASSSPWAKIVRERFGKSAFAIDLSQAGPEYRELEYYRIENATATKFPESSVRGASLHCAYEMFARDDDVQLLREMARILRPGAKLIIAPLYMHTHYCAYSTAEYYGKGYSDPRAKEYVRLDCTGVPSSRKYDARTLKERVLTPLESFGMKYRLFALRNKEELGTGIYCHFILEVAR